MSIMSSRLGSRRPAHGSNRAFGVVFSAVFVLISIYPGFSGGNIRGWAAAISLVFLFFAVFLPATLATPNRLWWRFGIAVGEVVSPIGMAFVYATSIVPISCLLKIMGKDPMQRQFNPHATTYWIESTTSTSSMNEQF